MVKPVLDTESVDSVRNRILTIKANGTWEQAAKHIGVSRGYLYRVAKGTRPASNTLRVKLGLPPNTVSVSPLPCGHAELAKRCPICQPRSTTPNAQRKRSKRIEAMRAGLQLARTLDSMTG